MLFESENAHKFVIGRAVSPRTQLGVYSALQTRIGGLMKGKGMGGELGSERSGGAREERGKNLSQ